MVYMTNFVFEVLLITICLNSYVYFVHLFCSLVFFKQLWLKLQHVLIAINHAFFFLLLMFGCRIFSLMAGYSSWMWSISKVW